RPWSRPTGRSSSSRISPVPSTTASPRKRSPRSSPTWHSTQDGRQRCQPRKLHTTRWSKATRGHEMANEFVVGYISLGTMGGRRPTNLEGAASGVVVQVRRGQWGSHHRKTGAEGADPPRALAKKGDVIFPSLPEPADVERVALGADGIIEGVKKGAAYF